MISCSMLRIQEQMQLKTIESVSSRLVFCICSAAERTRSHSVMIAAEKHSVPRAGPSACPSERSVAPRAALSKYLQPTAHA